MTIKEAATILNKHPDTVRRWIRSGKLRAYKLSTDSGFEYDIDQEDLEKIMPSLNQVPKLGGEDSKPETKLPHAESVTSFISKVIRLFR